MEILQICLICLNLSNLASALMVRYDINPNYFANAFSANLSPKVQKKKKKKKSWYAER